MQNMKKVEKKMELGEKHIGDLHTGKKHTEFFPFGYKHMRILAHSDSCTIRIVAQKPHAHQEFCTSENCTFRMEETFASTDNKNFEETSCEQ